MVQSQGTIKSFGIVFKGRPLKMDFVRLLIQIISGSYLTRIKTVLFGS